MRKGGKARIRSAHFSAALNKAGERVLMKHINKLFLSTIVLIFLISLLSLFGCTEEQRMKANWKFKRITGRESWLATVYPNKHDLTVSRDLGWFPSLADCRTAAQRELSLNSTPYPEMGDYECGLNCETLSKWPGLWICEETMH